MGQTLSEPVTAKETAYCQNDQYKVRILPPSFARFSACVCVSVTHSLDDLLQEYATGFVCLAILRFCLKLVARARVVCVRSANSRDYGVVATDPKCLHAHSPPQRSQWLLPHASAFPTQT